MAKITREKFKTWGNVFDAFTERNLFKLASQGFFEDLESPISIGKEANIFTALTNQGKRVIIKIYRLETCDFKRMYDYIRYDPRYANLKRSRREIIFNWTQRELRNLMKARECGVRVPLPLTRLHNILVLEYIGNKEPAPKIKDSMPETKKEKQLFFDKIKIYMKKMYKAGLIHADLSEFNILNHNNNPVLIDFSQATVTKSVRANELLERDIKNMIRFFKKHGLEEDLEELERLITG